MSSIEPSRKSFLSWLSPAGAIVILICFFLPWLEVHCSGKKIIGSGFSFALQALPLWLIPILAILIILLSIWHFKGLHLSWFRIGVCGLSVLGLAMLVLTYVNIDKKLGGFIIRKITSHQIKIGLIGTLIGFLLVVISIAGVKKRKD